MASSVQSTIDADRAKLFLQFLQQNNNTYDQTVLADIKDVYCERGRFTCVIPVNEKVQNRYGTLHGGCIATLVDVIGSAALMTAADASGVSVDINVSFLRSAPLNEEVEIDAQVLRAGKSLATVQVDFRLKRTGELLSQGRHTKYLHAGTPLASGNEKKLTSKL
eukprot:gene14592-17243_t